MFIQNLSSEQQSVFLGLAKKIIEADKHIANEEEAMLQAITKQMNGDLRAKCVEMDQLKDIYDNKKTRVSMVLELLGVAHADKQYHISEKDIIWEIAKSCGITDDELRDMESWVVRQMALVSEANQFMED